MLNASEEVIERVLVSLLRDRVDCYHHFIFTKNAIREKPHKRRVERLVIDFYVARESVLKGVSGRYSMALLMVVSENV